MEEVIVPEVGAIYQLHSEIRKVVGINAGQNSHPDVIFMVPEKKRNYSQWLPLWADWAQKATVISR
jgi:hypothetical protein